MKKALIVYGGWDGHDPYNVAMLFKDMLEKEGFSVELSDTLSVYDDKEKLLGLDLLVPHWTMGELTVQQLENVLDAIAGGVGVAGVHAGLADAFHDRPDWQFMAGSQFVTHPAGQHLRYKVNVDKNSSSSILEGVDSFVAETELYYLHVDPCVNVLATINFPTIEDGEVDDHVIIRKDFEFSDWCFDPKYEKKFVHYSNMPVLMPAAYTKMYGKGRVFYCSLGHNAEVLKQKDLNRLVLNGMLWAAK